MTKVSVREIADAIGGCVRGDGDVELSGANALDAATATELAFVNEGFRDQAAKSGAGALVVGVALEGEARPQIVVGDPKLAMARAVARFFAPPGRARGIREPVWWGDDTKIGSDAAVGPFASIGDRTRIGARATIHAGVAIGDDCELGDDVVLHANVVIESGTRIGSRVRVQGGSVIGSDGFGYVPSPEGLVAVPQIGRVVIEDDVDIGAGCTIDRATFGETVIRAGAKIDNLVQIAHNVEVGGHSIVVSQVGISGSTRLGRGVMVGGQCGLTEHIHIGDGARIAAGSGLHKDVAAGASVGGAPAYDAVRWMKAQAVVPKLPELRRKVRDLERRIDGLEQD